MEAGLCFILDMGSVISPKTFEKQGLDLIEKKVSGATYLHYTVNVNFLAWIYLGATNSEPGTLMHAHLLKRQQQYEKNILIALHRIGVLDPPSMSLFQALLSGVRVSQYLHSYRRLTAHRRCICCSPASWRSAGN